MVPPRRIWNTHSAEQPLGGSHRDQSKGQLNGLHYVEHLVQRVELVVSLAHQRDCSRAGPGGRGFRVKRCGWGEGGVGYDCSSGAPGCAWRCPAPQRGQAVLQGSSWRAIRQQDKPPQPCRSGQRARQRSMQQLACHDGGQARRVVITQHCTQQKNAAAHLPGRGPGPQGGCPPCVPSP